MRHTLINTIYNICLLLLLPTVGAAQQKTMHRVATNDCGVPDAQPFLIKGNNYTMPDHIKSSKEAVTCNFGNKVIYAFNHLDIHADYQLEVVYLADNERIQHIVVDGNEIQEPVTLEAGKEQRYLIDLPRKAFAYSQLVLVFECAGKGPNAIVSELNLYSSNPKVPQPFEGEEKRALINTQTYKVDMNVDAETVLPVYTPLPKQTAGSYRPTLSLNGSWLFNPHPETDFYKHPASTDWKAINVPGQWSMQGFAVDSAAFAGYRTSFTLPEDWKNQHVRLRFDGVHSEYYIYINGAEAGYHLGGMTAYETDITPYLKTGTNEIALAVRSESLADMLGSLTQYAAHQLGGITRKVTLFAVPPIHLSDIRIETDLDNFYRNAMLRVQTAVTCPTDQPVNEHLALRLSIPELSTTIESRISIPGTNGTQLVVLSDSIVAPKLWTNETPNLYTLHLELYNGNEVIETIEKRFGFREIEIKDNELLVNGQPVKLRGVCHHEMHPLTGRVVDKELLRRDVELYREANCNFIRTSHYPPCEEMLDLCDELGMFVEVEAPVCWIGHHANENWKTLNYLDPSYYSYILQATMETIHLNRNHPSVLFWSMANESYWNKEFAQIQEYVNKADTTRPHSFHDQAYGGFNNQGSTAPIANIHYPGPNGYKTAAQSDRPMVYGEYCHLNVYNRSELVTDPGIRSDWALALSPTWENMYKTKGVLGGSIWSGIDDIFQLPDGRAVGYGPWGPIDGWRRTKPEYWDMKKIYSPIRVLASELSPDGQLIVKIENRNTYLNLNDLTVTYRSGDKSGRLAADIPPSQQGVISIPADKLSGSGQVYLSFTDPRGFVIDEFLLSVGQPEQDGQVNVSLQPTRLKKSENRYIITGKGFRCEVSRQTGQILTLIKDGTEVLNGGPWLMALPLTGGGCYPNHNADTPVFNDLCSNWQADLVQVHRKDENVYVTVQGKYCEFQGEYQLCINANGHVGITYSFTALQDVNPRQWGMVFGAPRTFDKTFWQRTGLWSIYPDDHISRPSGEAPLFYSGLPATINPRTNPSWNWNKDFTALGSNDFRSTRRNIRYAGLKDNQGHRITVHSNHNRQHWRSWLDNNQIRFLVADFVTAGNEMFLEGYYAPYRKPIKKGESIQGRIELYAE